MTGAARGVLLVGIALVVWLALDLLLLVAAGILIAIFLRTLACGLASRTRLSFGWGLAVTVVLILGGLVLAAALYAPAPAEQADQMTETIPAAFSELTGWVRQYGWGAWLLDQLVGDGNSGEIVNQATRLAGAIANGLIGFVIVIFVALYLAVDPGTYLRGILRLFPVRRRRRIAEVLFAVGHTLRWWLAGQAIAMAFVGLAMGTGLAIIGVPLSFALGVLAGLLEFIPLVGPLLGLGPALLLAAAERAGMALYVLLLYTAVQSFESYLVTPLVQRRVVHLPPVLTITAQVAWSWAAGPLGLLLAVPITAAAMVAVQMLYLEDVLHTRMTLEAEAAGREELDEVPYLRPVIPTPAAAQQ